MPDTFSRAGEEGGWALSGLADDVRPLLADIMAGGAPGALATLVEIDGPSPRPLGAQMAVAPDGQTLGYVSSGCVEGSLALIGREVAEDGAPRRIVFGQGSPYVDVRLMCGGRIDLFVERIAPNDDTMRDVLQARDSRTSIVRCVGADGRAEIRDRAPGAAIAGVDENGTAWRRYDPQTRVIILGSDPVALATSQLARTAGMEAVLVRRLGPRNAPDGIASLYLSATAEQAFARMPLDAWTAVITTSHDLDDDHEALALALPSNAFYVGALGSRARLAERMAKLEALNLPWAAVRRLRAPVGLDIGAASPYEIAISILADVVRAQRKG